MNAVYFMMIVSFLIQSHGYTTPISWLLSVIPFSMCATHSILRPATGFTIPVLRTLISLFYSLPPPFSLSYFAFFLFPRTLGFPHVSLSHAGLCPHVAGIS